MSPGVRRAGVAALALVVLAADPATADKPRVGISPFTGGPAAVMAQKVVMRSLAEKVELVPLGGAPGARGKKGAKAKKGGRPKKAARPKKVARHKRGRGPAPAPVVAAPEAPAAPAAPVAGAAPVEVVISGALVRKRAFFLSVKNTATGKTETQNWPVKGAAIERATYALIASDAPEMVARALGRPLDGEAPAPEVTPISKEPPTPVAKEPAATPTEPIPTSPANPAATPVANPSATPSATPDTTPPANPPATEAPRAWIVDGRAGFLLGGRSFAFDQAGTPGYSVGANPGVHLDLTIYPLATLARRGTLGSRALAGLGLGATGDFLFYPDSVPKPCANVDMNGRCADRYPTNELRAEGGLRWRFDVLNREDRPSLLAAVEFGLHSFTIAKRTLTRGDGTTTQVDVGPPDLLYQYVTVGIGARVPLGQRLAFSAMFRGHVLIDAGPIARRAAYGAFGPVSGFGLRASLGAELRIWRGLFAALEGFYERFSLSFTHPPDGATYTTTTPCNEPLPCGTTGGATDQYYGGTANVGYRW